LHTIASSHIILPLGVPRRGLQMLAEYREV
jgi:hypothetical protein